MVISFRKFISEASIVKPEYVEGHKFAWNGTSIKEFDIARYKKNDIFTIVGKSNDAITIGNTGEYEKYLQAPDGKVYLFRGNKSFKSTSFTHVKGEGAGIPSGAEWEDLIVYAYNNKNGTKTDSKTEDVALKYWSNYAKLAEEIAKNFDTELSTNQLVHTGRGTGEAVKLGQFWKEVGASNKTPKTDIASFDFSEKISLKKAGGSQLISAEKKESLAIVKAAFAEMGADTSFSENLIASIEENMTKLISSETINDINKRIASGSSDEIVVDYLEKDKGNKKLSRMLESYINENTAANSLFAKYVILEAATGNNKFGSSSSRAAANLLAKFDTQTKYVVVEEIRSIQSPIIVSYSKKIKPYVAFKKGASGSEAYSAMRFTIANEGTLSLKSIITEELSSVSDLLLNEDMLNEGPMDMLRRAGQRIKSMGATIKQKFQSAIKSIIDKVKGALRAIAKRGKKLMDSLLSFLGLEIGSTSGIVSDINL